jgi:hypothetical protein
LTPYEASPNLRFVQAHYAGDGTPCVVVISFPPGRPWAKSLAVAGRPVSLLDGDFCHDDGRLIRADDAGGFA